MLMKAAVLELAPHLKIAKSATTRAPREPDDALAYDFISVERFELKRQRGDFIEAVRHGNNFYGYDRGTVNVAMHHKHGICIATEHGILELKKAGYLVRPVKVTSFGEEAKAMRDAFYQEHPERVKDDYERSRMRIDYDLEILNSFEPGGKEKAIKLLVDYIANVTKCRSSVL
ncbi:hypothetical protein A3C91_03075 [Candidatus Azambacteria bacterium RIFCSPHIGHO2_02_FULL_52_12]|nr:MAG: hypothetical protein A3C91_03075 [Candidatus Azambacteria bacterium RIFCSPHIGHO2_02_FULL_52_12]OGD37568.1 MAG: hypothetical protein A2850_04015 [Candidatus Azambacteria bacterium RIFCSPHIGHO2_01_FULL_51_74]